MDYCLNRIKGLYLQKLRMNLDDIPLYDLLFKTIKQAIEEGDIPGGTAMPSTRKLATELKLSRSTIVQVYELLKTGHLIDSRPGSGYVVRTEENLTGRKAAPAVHASKTELSETGKSFIDSMTYLESNPNEEPAFRPGLPPLDIFPVNQWKILNNMYWRHVTDSDLSFVSNSGTQRLRESLAGYLNFTRKIKCEPRQIIIVSGSLQSIYAIGNILLNPGETVLLENPTFPNVISLFRGLRANIQPVGVDQEGLRVSSMDDIIGLHPKMIHTVPSCHYPEGYRMSLHRRMELIDWAHAHNCVIIENDYEHEVNNYDDFIPSIYSLDKHERTFFLGTFNRLLHPSIRVGYMIVPPYYLDAVEALLRHLHRFVPNSKQHILSKFIEKNYIYHHIKNLLEVADDRREYFTRHFQQYFEGVLSVHASDTRSLHLLARLPDNMIDSQLIHHLSAQNIMAHTLSKTFVGDIKENGLILGYSPVNKKEMKEKLMKMHKVIKSIWTG
jgi:GntR family transcriptional regulator/MocR family aminotransferase